MILIFLMLLGCLLGLDRLVCCVLGVGVVVGVMMVFLEYVYVVEIVLNLDVWLLLVVLELKNVLFLLMWVIYVVSVVEWCVFFIFFGYVRN